MPASADAATLNHWADQAAARVLGAHPGRDVYVVAAGITPSGVVHIGNFREVITVDLVARALRDRGAHVRFIYSWDDFDVFRKVPLEMPKAEQLRGELRRSICDVTDPYGDCDSYASHFIRELEASLEPLGIRPEFIRQSQRYRAGDYAMGIRRALEHTAEIRAIIDEHRTEPLPESWLPLAGFCAECGRDELELTWSGEWQVSYRCQRCGHSAEADLRDGGSFKLPWRVDWPMRWAEEGVVFEPGGKDHSTAGGSYDTAREIIAPVYGGRAPEYVAYDFVRIKGTAGKISSSAGNVISVSDCLEVYEPEVLRWLFASYRPGVEFQISFDLDVIKLYEDFDRQERLAREPDSGGRADRKRASARRLLQLASLDHQPVGPGDPLTFVPGFRGVSMVLQAFDGDLDCALGYYKALGQISTDAERARFRARARCVWHWVESYAPDEFRFRVRADPVRRKLSDDERRALQRLVDAVRTSRPLDESALVPHLKRMCEGTALTPQTFFPVAYDLLIGRPKGPKLSTLIPAIGAERAERLLSTSL